MCHGTNWAKKILVASWCETRIGFCQLRVELYDSNLKWMATYDVDESPNSERTQHRMKSKNDFLIYFVFYCVVAYLVPSPLWHLYVLKWKACNKLITADQIFTPFGKNSIQTGIYVIYSATSCYCTQAAGKQRTHHAPCVPMKWIPFGCACVCLRIRSAVDALPNICDICDDIRQQIGFTGLSEMAFGFGWWNAWMHSCIFLPFVHHRNDGIWICGLCILELQIDGIHWRWRKLE